MSTCDRCKHMGAMVSPDKSMVMICRRYPPRVFSGLQATGHGQAAPWTITAWPNVKNSDACGEFAAKLVS